MTQYDVTPAGWLVQYSSSSAVTRLVGVEEGVAVVQQLDQPATARPDNVTRSGVSAA